MTTLFQKIISGEIPSFKVWEDEAHYAFLTIEPIQPGHTLVVPKEPISHLFDMDDVRYLQLMKVVRQVANHIQSKLHCEKVGVIVEGYGIKDHVHVHLVPLSGPGQLDFARAKKSDHTELIRMRDLMVD
ncbi:MAG: HIT family protein [bacterium]